MNVFGPPSSRTCGRRVLPRVSTEMFWPTMASKSDAMSWSGGTPIFWSELMSVSAKTPHARHRVQLDAVVAHVAELVGGIWSLALILSITAPVPPAHLSFIDGILVFLPVSGSSLKMMIFASWPPSSTTEPASG